MLVVLALFNRHPLQAALVVTQSSRRSHPLVEVGVDMERKLQGLAAQAVVVLVLVRLVAEHLGRVTLEARDMQVMLQVAVAVQEVLVSRLAPRLVGLVAQESPLQLLDRR